MMYMSVDSPLIKWKDNGDSQWGIVSVTQRLMLAQSAGRLDLSAPLNNTKYKYPIMFQLWASVADYL